MVIRSRTSADNCVARLLLLELYSSCLARRVLCLAVFALVVLPAAFAQDDGKSREALPEAPSASTSSQESTDKPGPKDGVPQAPQSSAQPQSDSVRTGLEGKQTKRILGIIPNFRSVSANEQLPPQGVKDKFIESTKDSFDYSSFIFVGLLAGTAQAQASYPEFRQGAAGFGRYYWHTFADQTDENYQVEFFFPVALHQDPRYYTLGHGGFARRALYSFSRVLITRTDHGHETFNSSEIVGAGAAAGISDSYYPSPERTWTKTGQRWLLNVSLDGVTFVFKEFWPDINNKIFH